MLPSTQFLDCPNPEGKGTHKLAIHSWGEVENPKKLICVHGMTRNARDFDFLAATLEKDYHILCPDIPGRGMSGWLPEPAWYGYPLYVADMFFMLERLGLKKVDWVGTSMGGLIGMFVAASDPARIGRFVMNDIGPLIPKASLERLATYVGDSRIFKDEAEALDYARVVYAPWGIREEAHLAHLARHSLKTSAKGLTFHYDPAIGHAFRNPDGSPKEMQDIVLWETWEKVTCPTLLIRGGDSDLLPAEVAARMWQLHPDMDYVEYPGIGHAPSLMDAGQIERVRAFLLGDQ